MAAQPAVSRLVPREQESRLDQWVNLFEVSPDQSEVAFVDEKGGVFRLELASGILTEMQPDAGQDGIWTIPSWRKAGELCFARPLAEPRDETTVEIVLFTNGEARSLSAHWPAQVTKGFLDKQARVH